MDRYSHTDFTTSSNLGICNIEAVKFKLLFVGELCRSKTTTTHNKLFNICISQIIIDDICENSLTYDLITTLVKYDLFSFLVTNINDDFIPGKLLWSKIVRQSIEGVGLWCLTPLSTIFQFYRGDQLESTRKSNVNII